MKGEGPRQELMDSMRPLTQFYTAQEFGQVLTDIYRVTQVDIIDYVAGMSYLEFCA